MQAVIGTFMATFFNSRFPSITLGGAVIQILLFPCAKVLEFALPDWGVTVFGTRHSLNPGPWVSIILPPPPKKNNQVSSW